MFVVYLVCRWVNFAFSGLPSCEAHVGLGLAADIQKIQKNSSQTSMADSFCVRCRVMLVRGYHL